MIELSDGSVNWPRVRRSYSPLGSVRTELLAFALALVDIVTLKLENIDKCSFSFKLSLCRNMNSYEDNERS